MSEEFKVCDRLYYSDLSNKKRELMQEYLSLLTQGKYTDASNFLNSHNAMSNERDGVWFTGAELLSFIDHEIKKSVNYVNGMDVIKKIFVTLEDEEIYPEDIFDGAHWISNIDNDNILNLYVSGISELYTGNEIGLIE